MNTATFDFSNVKHGLVMVKHNSTTFKQWDNTPEHKHVVCIVDGKIKTPLSVFYKVMPVYPFKKRVIVWAESSKENYHFCTDAVADDLHYAIKHALERVGVKSENVSHSSSLDYSDLIELAKKIEPTGTGFKVI